MYVIFIGEPATTPEVLFIVFIISIFYVSFLFASGLARLSPVNSQDFRFTWTTLRRRAFCRSVSLPFNNAANLLLGLFEFISRFCRAIV